MTSKKFMSITAKQQQLLVYMLNNGQKTTYFNQNIYTNYRSFEKAIHQLIRANYITYKSTIQNKKFVNCYKLVLNIEIIDSIAHLFKHFNEVNKK